MYAELDSIDSILKYSLPIKTSLVRLSVTNHLSFAQPCSNDPAHVETVFICNGKAHPWKQTE